MLKVGILFGVLSYVFRNVYKIYGYMNMNIIGFPFFLTVYQILYKKCKVSYLNSV